jgi:hypothetical protein
MKKIPNEGLNIKPINPEFQNLTTERLRSWKAFKEIPNEEAMDIIETITLFSEILIDIVQQREGENRIITHNTEIKEPKKMAA